MLTKKTIDKVFIAGQYSRTSVRLDIYMRCCAGSINVKDAGCGKYDTPDDLSGFGIFVTNRNEQNPDQVRNDIR